MTATISLWLKRHWFNVCWCQVRAVRGETYMLSHDEELWEKELPPAVETLLLAGKDPLADRSDRSKGAEKSEKRDKTKVVTFRVPHNAAVQIYDYKEKKARYRNYLRLCKFDTKLACICMEV